MGKLSNEDTIVIPGHADDDLDEPKIPKSTGKYFTEDEVNRIRQEEKDKLYERLEKEKARVKAIEDQLGVLAKEREEAIKSAEEKARSEAEIQKKREFEELSAKDLLAKQEDQFKKQINSVEEEWSKKFAELERDREIQAALLDKEREKQALDTYRNRRASEEYENIIPEIIDLISGNTQEEIENSIAILRARSSAIIESMNQAGQLQNPRIKGTTVSSPPIGPLENQEEYQTLTTEQIRNMPMDQYEKMRGRLLQARPVRGRF